jgi:hypothetical protein
MQTKVYKFKLVPQTNIVHGNARPKTNKPREGGWASPAHL